MVPRRRILPGFGHYRPFRPANPDTFMIPFTQASLVSLALFTTALVAQGGEQTLRTTAKKGASIWLVREQSQSQTIDQGGQEMEIGNSTAFTLHLTIKDVDDKGQLIVETEVVRVQSSVKMGPMGEADFDSASPATDNDDGGGGGFGPDPKAMAKQPAKLVGKKFIAKVDARGKATALEGTAELVDDKGRSGMGGGMGSPITEDSLKGLVEAAFGNHPEKPVAVGATWEETPKSTGRMPSQHKVTMTLAKLDDAMFEISAAGTVEKPSDDKLAELGGESGDEMMREMLKNMSISNGKIVGSQKISRQDGFVLEANHVTSMDVEMETPMGAMSMTVKNTTTTKRTSAEAAMPKKPETPPAPKTGDK